MTRVNWPQAFAEIGLLALGVLVALGGDAWMDHRRDREAEHAYLVSLREDFKETQRLTAEYIENNRRSLGVCLELLEALAGPPDAVSPDGVGRLVKDCFWVYTLEPARATYQDLLNSGDHDLLQSIDLRLTLARSNENLQTLDRIDELQWEHWFRFELEFLRQHHDLGQVYPDYSGDAKRENVDIEPVRYPDAGFGPDMPALRSREFRNIVIARTIIYEDAIVVATVGLRRFGGVLQLIDEELRRFDG
jgi:hypothetical protein